jgi:serine protease Do
MAPPRWLHLPAALITLALAPAFSPAALALQEPDELPPQFSAISVASGYLGVDIRDVDPESAQRLKLKEVTGAEITALDRDAPACKAGLRRGDVIQSINGQTIANSDMLRRVMRDMPVGKPVTVAFFRSGKPMTVHLQLADREVLAQQAWARHFHVDRDDTPFASSGFFSPRSFWSGGAPDPSPEEKLLYVGAQVDPLTEQLAKFFGVKAGCGLLVKSVADGSPAAVAGLQAGDIILRANDAPLAGPAEWIEVLRNHAGHPVALSVMRNHRTRNLSITVDAPPSKTSSMLQEEREMPEGSS